MSLHLSIERVGRPAPRRDGRQAGIGATVAVAWPLAPTPTPYLYVQYVKAFLGDVGLKCSFAYNAGCD